MTLEARVNEDMKTAMKGGEKARLTTLRSLRAMIIEFNKSGSDAPMSPDDEFKLLKSAAKKRKDAIEMYKKGGRQDLVDIESYELQVIEEYLPEQMSEEDVAGKIEDIIKQTGATEMKDFGRVMGMAMKELKDQVDGSVVQKIVREKLGAS